MKKGLGRVLKSSQIINYEHKSLGEEGDFLLLLSLGMQSIW